MNILHLSTENSWRGGENQLRQLLAGTFKRGFNHIVVIQPGFSYKRNFADYAVLEEIRVRNELNIVSALRIAFLAHQRRIDVIHAHTARGHTIGIFVKLILKFFRKRAPALIVHRRVEQAKKLGPFSRWKYLNSQVDKYIAVSKAIAQGLISSGVSSEKIEMIHSSVEKKSYPAKEMLREKLCTEFSIPKNEPLFIFVGAIEKLKGIDILLAAWDLVLQKNSQKQESPHLLIVGDGSLKASVEGLKMKDTTLTGFRNDASELIAASDVLVLPTRWEGLGTVLLDGALAEVALIGSNVGGVPEIILNDNTGLLVEVNSPNALYKAMDRLLSDPQLRQTLAENAKIHVQTNFSATQMCDAISKVWLKI